MNVFWIQSRTPSPTQRKIKYGVSTYFTENEKEEQHSESIQMSTKNN